MAHAGALNDCPFQGDATNYNSGQPAVPPPPVGHPCWVTGPSQAYWRIAAIHANVNFLLFLLSRFTVNRDVGSLLGEFTWSRGHVVPADPPEPYHCPPVTSGDHTKALIGQLIIFNQILGELRLDIREQVRQTDGWTDGQTGELLLCSSAPQVKEMALIRNSILECQVCGESTPPDASFLYASSVSCRP